MYKISSSFVKEINERVCELFGTKSTVVDIGKIESALSPFSNGYDSDEVMASKIFRNLIVAHGFLDGNKRTACVALAIILKPTCSMNELAQCAIDVANGKYRNDIGDLPSRLYKNLKESFVGKDVWCGAVNVYDGTIEEAHTYKEAERNDFHHSLYFTPEMQDKMRDGECVFFCIYDDGEIQIDPMERSYEEIDEKYLLRRIKEQLKDLESGKH